MKVKILIPILLVLVVSLFVGNGIYGKISAKRLDVYLQKSFKRMDIKYDDVEVNPLWSKITFRNFSFSDFKSKLTIESKVLNVTMKHTEALAISKTHSVDKLTKLALDFRQLKVHDGKELVLASENTLFDFKGNVNRKVLQGVGERFPEDTQYARLLIQDGSFTSHTSPANIYESMLIGMQHIETLQFEFLFQPHQQKICIEKLELRAENLNFTGEAEMIYRGKGLDDFLASDIAMKYESHQNGKMLWGDSRTTGVYSVESLDSKFEGVLDLDDKGEVLINSSEANLTLGLKDMTIVFTDDRKKNIDMSLSMLGLVAEDLFVDEFIFQGSLGSGKCVIDSTRLILPMLEADFYANIDVDSLDVGGSSIQGMEMRISNVKPKLNNAISHLAASFGIKIPREGDDIVLEVTGSIKEPKVKGIHY